MTDLTDLTALADLAALTDLTALTAPAELEASGSQWAIGLPDGRVILTGSGQERTERDADWENTHPQGRGGCSALVRDVYLTPWRPINDPVPVMAHEAWAAMAQASEVPALPARVADLFDLILF